MWIISICCGQISSCWKLQSENLYMLIQKENWKYLGVLIQFLRAKEVHVSILLSAIYFLGWQNVSNSALWPIFGNSFPKLRHEFSLLWLYFHSISKHSCSQGSKNCGSCAKFLNFWNWCKIEPTELQFWDENLQNRP